MKMQNPGQDPTRRPKLPLHSQRPVTYWYIPLRPLESVHTLCLLFGKARVCLMQQASLLFSSLISQRDFPSQSVHPGAGRVLQWEAAIAADGGPDHAVCTDRTGRYAALQGRDPQEDRGAVPQTPCPGGQSFHWTTFPPEVPVHIPIPEHS